MASTEPDVKMRILLAAKKLFAKQGFEGTTVRQICEEAGANVALVSYHFGGKDQMFVALFDTFFPGKELLDIYEPYFKDPVKGIKLMITEIIRLRRKDPDLITILQQEILLNTARIETIRNHAFPIWKILRHLLEEGRSKGLYHFQSLDNTMLFVMGTVLFHKNREYFKPLLTEEEPSFEDLVNDTCRFVFAGLGLKQNTDDINFI